MKTVTIIAAFLVIVFSSLSVDSISEPHNFLKPAPADKALTVLKNKCNVCHQYRNPRMVFTSANMEHFAPLIYKQVFVKKRMPKGNKIKLNEDEKELLLAWLEAFRGNTESR